MARTTLKESITNIIERRWSITLNLTVQISEVTQERIRDSYRWHEEQQDLLWEMAERENRLLLALLKNEAALDRFLKLVMVSDLETQLGIDLCSKFEFEDEEEILEAVYSRMNETDARYYQEVKDEGHLAENISILDECFVIDWSATEIREVKKDSLKE